MGAQPGTQIGSPETGEAAPSPSQGQGAEAESLRPGLSPPHPEDLTEHPASPQESCGRQTHLLRKVGHMQVSGSIVKLGRIPGSAPRGTETEVAFHATGDPASRVGGSVLLQREDTSAGPARAVKMTLCYRRHTASSLISSLNFHLRFRKWV